MRALTIWQPWAWLIAEGHKGVENRNWPLPKHLIGERVAIHAASRLVGYDMIAFDILDEFGIVVPPATEIAVRCVVATVRLVACVKTSLDPFFNGPFGFEMDERCKLPEPVPCRGFQGFWTLPDDVLRQVVEQGGGG